MKLKKNVTLDKLRGGFYTPSTIADFILSWAINGDKHSRILEPSCGDGSFLKSLKKGKYDFDSITAIEYDKEEADKAQKIDVNNKEIIVGDFHRYCNSTKDRYDIVIGNPPYIRYQYFDKFQQQEAIKIFNRNGISYSKLLNSWGAFVVGCTELLKEHGKLGFVLPSEILQVINARVIREFLLKEFNKISIVSFKKLVFEKIQQDVILLLCEKGKENSHIEFLEVENDACLKNIDLGKLKNPSKKIYTSEKWTRYFLDQEELDFLHKIENCKKISMLGDFAKVEVGITTGSNEFFTVTDNTVKKYHLEKYAKPLLGRSVQIKGCNFTFDDLLENKKNNAKANLLLFSESKKIKDKNVLDYLSYGVTQGVSSGYKCKIRNEWQIIPAPSISDAFFSRRNSLSAKFVLNECGAYSTDTMHRVWIKDNVQAKSLIVSYYNSITFCFVELAGRTFGGGALELMPSEVENLYIPYNESNNILFDTLNQMIRESRSIEKIIDFMDEEILIKKLKFSRSDVEIAKKIRNKLSQRRLNKK